MNREGYEKGRIDGFNKGKQDGYNKGFEDAKAQIRAEATMAQAPVPDMQLNGIGLKWREFHCADRLAEYFGGNVVLHDENMECLKETVKSAIWKLEIGASDQAHTIILKIFKAPVAGQDLVELNMYRNAGSILLDSMPQIYWIQEGVNGQEVWVLMEYVPQLKGKIQFTPDHFNKIIPALAKLHARTYNGRFYEHWDLFAEWLPRYHSDSAIMERQKTNGETLEYLDKAMKHPELKQVLQSSHHNLQSILLKGPEFFPELIQAGKSIIHNDLQTPNIGCGNVGEENWNIKFIDWEGARFAPCWFDMFNLIGVFFAYRKDLKSEEDAVIRRCAHLYAAEMEAHGIKFVEDPVRLYKMAYLQRVLERSVYLQLNWALEGRKQAFLLEGYLQKIEVWGKELGLY